MATEAFVLAADPYNPQHGLLFPLVGQRLDSMAQAYPNEMDHPLFIRQALARVYAGDKSVRLLIALAPDGQLVGHVLVSVERHGEKEWVYVWQCEVDKGYEAVPQFIAHLREWKPELDILMGTTRDKAWARKYGFEPVRTIMKLKVD